MTREEFAELLKKLREKSENGGSFEDLDELPGELEVNKFLGHGDYFKDDDSRLANDPIFKGLHNSVEYVIKRAPLVRRPFNFAE